MTTPQIIKIASAVAVSLDSVLAYGDRIADVPGVPPGLAHSWPLVLIGIIAIDRGLHAYIGDPPPKPAPTSPFDLFTSPPSKIPTQPLAPVAPPK